MKKEMEKPGKISRADGITRENVEGRGNSLSRVMAVTPNLRGWHQQIPGTISDISVQKNAIQYLAKNS